MLSFNSVEIPESIQSIDRHPLRYHPHPDITHNHICVNFPLFEHSTGHHCFLVQCDYCLSPVIVEQEFPVVRAGITSLIDRGYKVVVIPCISSYYLTPLSAHLGEGFSFVHSLTPEG